MARIEEDGGYQIPADLDLGKIISSAHYGIAPQIKPELIGDIAAAAVRFQEDLARMGKTPEEISKRFHMAMDFVGELLQRRFEWEARNKNRTTSTPEAF